MKYKIHVGHPAHTVIETNTSEEAYAYLWAYARSREPDFAKITTPKAIEFPNNRTILDNPALEMPAHLEQLILEKIEELDIPLYEAFPNVSPMNIHEVMAACPVGWKAWVKPRMNLHRGWTGSWIWEAEHETLKRCGKTLTAPDGVSLISAIWEQQRAWDFEDNECHLETWNQKLNLGLDP